MIVVWPSLLKNNANIILFSSFIVWWFWGGLSLNPLRITFMAFVMIGANIIPAVATIREESNRKGGKNPNHWFCYINNNFVRHISISCSFACSQLSKSITKTSFCKGVKSNPGSYLFPIWWDECICGWSITTSRSGTEKWQVHNLQNTKYYSVWLTFFNIV